MKRLRRAERKRLLREKKNDEVRNKREPLNLKMRPDQLTQNVLSQGIVKVKRSLNVWMRTILDKSGKRKKKKTKEKIKMRELKNGRKEKTQGKTGLGLGNLGI